MMRAVLLVVLILTAAMRSVTAGEFYREELRIPMAAAGPRGLEALLIRPAGTQRYPLALISHGAPAEASERPSMTPYWLYTTAIEFARRGFAAVVVMRRGFGNSGGDFAESGCCAPAKYLHSGRASATDLRAALAAMKGRADVTTEGMIAVGISAGGFASLALTENPPPGLAAVISFAGGRRHAKPSDDGVREPGDEAALVAAFATIGKTSRIPMLWIYAQNDKYFGPDMAHRLHAAFTLSGGRAQLIDAPAFGSDGHSLLIGTGGRSIWTPMVDGFLRAQNLGARELLAAPTPPGLAPPPRLSEKGRASFEEYLAAGPHKAFAVSPGGAFGQFSGKRSAAEALGEALTGCAKHAPDCAAYAIDDQLVGKANGGSL
jgi:dienelactone hydrolase